MSCVTLYESRTRESSTIGGNGLFVLCLAGLTSFASKSRTLHRDLRNPQSRGKLATRSVTASTAVDAK